MLLFTVSSSSLFANSYIGIKRFSFSPSAAQFYQSVDILLYQRLNFELLPRGIKPILLEDTIPEGCVSVAGGAIDIIDSIPILRFSISGSSVNEEVKMIPLDEQPIDAVVDILSLKVRHFLEQNLSGKLRVSSTPLDCDLLLNGIKIGKTPAELTLEQGVYTIQLLKQYCFPYKDSVSIAPGREITLTPTLEFQGHNYRPWILSAFFFTGCAIAAQLLELKFKTDYEDLGYGDDRFTQYFDRYRYCNIAKIGLLIPSATCWSITIYHVFQNKTLKKRTYNNLF